MNRYLLDGFFSESEDVVTRTGYVNVKLNFIRNHKLDFGLQEILDELCEANIFPTELGFDFITLGMMVYLADTRIKRQLHSQDSWSREICISVPVSDVEKWNREAALITRMLNFLSGDIWKIAFKNRSMKLEELVEAPEELNDEINTLSLFSGGMDSLISTINLLEKNSKILLISHAGDNYTPSFQRKIMDGLRKQYPENNISRLYWHLIFDKNLIPGGNNENSTRSRSFLFICMGLMAATGLRNVTKLLVPENGYIAMNIPLDRLRIGSLSTKTTHPFYLDIWNELISNLNLGKKVLNEYILFTKGEMADKCLNKDFLQSVIPMSISCSAPAKYRWKGAKIMHCGHCVPCIIRRAAMYKAFGNDIETEYYIDDINEAFRNIQNKKGINYRSFQLAISNMRNNPEIIEKIIYKSGPISNKDFAKDLAAMYKRGLEEVSCLIESYTGDKSDF